MAQSNKQQIKGEKVNSACGATTAVSEGFRRQQQQQQEEEEAPRERQQVKQQLGRGVVHRPSWSKRRKNQDSALAAKLDKFAFTRVYLYTENYS